jgi:hypothetical protein
MKKLIKYFLFFITLSTIAQPIVIKPIVKPFESSLGSLFEIVEIIDARPNKDYLGIVVDTVAHKLDTLIIQESAEQFLKDQINSCVFTKKEWKRTPVILKLNYWEINRRYSEDELLYFGMADVEIFVQNENGYYQATRLSYPLETRFKNPVSDPYSITNWYLWDAVIREINDKHNLKNERGKSILKDKESIRQCLAIAPIYCKDTLSTGVFKNLDEFMNNTPSITEFRYEVGEGKIKLFIPVEGVIGEFRRTRTAYGFYDGKQMYVLYNTIFMPVERVGNTYELKGLALKVSDLQLEEKEAKSLEDRSVQLANRKRYYAIPLGWNVPPSISAAGGALSLIGFLASQEKHNHRHFLDYLYKNYILQPAPIIKVNWKE